MTKALGYHFVTRISDAFNMHPSLRLFSAKAHQPLIRFVGKRSWPSAVEASHPHPAAPPDYSKSFSELSENHQAPTTNHVASESSNTAQVYQEFWEAPSRFWQPRSRELEDAEIDAVLSGGASLQ